MIMSFIMQYLRHPRSVGAVKASSKYLAEKMIEDVNFSEAECIVEIGAGTGAFTDKIVRKKQEETLLLVFEINLVFCRILKKKYGNLPNVHILHASAEHMDKYLGRYGRKRADYIISGLPFASLPIEVSHRILKKCSSHLAEGGSFITFQYTRLKVGMMRQFFPGISLKKEYRNLPPAYILTCRNQPMKMKKSKRGKK